jgi:flagellar biosynthetic protein FliR
MIYESADLVRTVSTWILPFFRISALVSVSPLFGNRAVPMRVKVAIAVALSIAIIPFLKDGKAIDPGSAEGVLSIFVEVLTGLVLGFSLRLAFLVLEIVGQLVAQLMGLGFASLVNPQSGIDVPVLSQFYIILATLVFLGLDGHLLIVMSLVESFSVIPVGYPALDYSALWTLAGQAGWVFAAALTLALPAVVTLLVVNLAFGVISRAAPQLHVVVIGFPLTLLFGFVIIWLSYATVVGEIDGLLARTFEQAQSIVRELQ